MTLYLGYTLKSAGDGCFDRDTKLTLHSVLYDHTLSALSLVYGQYSFGFTWVFL